MQRKLSFVILVLLCSLPLLAQDLTVDQIIAKNIEAHGGLDKLKAIKTAKVTGKLQLGPGIEAPMTAYFARPNDMRMEFTVQGLTGVQAYDGQAKTGWAIMPFQGKKDPEQMSADETKEFAQQANDGIEGPFVDYQAKGNKVELLGKEKLEGADAYKVKVTRASGDVDTIYLDADSFLEVKTEEKRTIRGNEVEGDSNIGDYKEVDGIVVPFSIDSGRKGAPQRQKITFEKYEFNGPVDHTMFVMPAVPKTPEPATKPSTPANQKPADKPKN
jgi:hypothetical protein